MNSSNQFQVGDILFSSWGYEQTNIDFYQIVKLTQKTISVQKISSENVSYSFIKPKQNQFIGKLFNRRIKSYSKDSFTMKISGFSETLCRYVMGDRGLRCDTSFR